MGKLYKAAKEALAKAKEQAEAPKAAGKATAADVAAVSDAKAAANLHYSKWEGYSAEPSHEAALIKQLRASKGRQGIKNLASGYTVLLMALQKGSTQPTPVAAAHPCFSVVSIHGLVPFVMA